MWTVTRQRRWPDGLNIVEISVGSFDYCNPDCLVAKYSGEGEEYIDPREAIEAAISIATAWQKKSEDEIFLAMGNTHGMTAAFDEEPLSEETFKGLREQGEKLYKSLPKCDECGNLIGKDTFKPLDYEDFEFCSEYCAEEWVRKVEEENECLADLEEE